MPLVGRERLNLSLMPPVNDITSLVFLHIVPRPGVSPLQALFHFGDEFFDGAVTFLGITEGTRDNDWDLLAGLTVLPGNDVILCANVVC